MASKRMLTGLAAACALHLGLVAGAAALSLSEFDRLVDYQQENFISTVLHFEYYRYRNDPETAHKADCMVELDQSTSGEGDAYLLSLIMQSLDEARINGARGSSVEGVIRTVIDRECRAP